MRLVCDTITGADRELIVIWLEAQSALNESAGNAKYMKPERSCSWVMLCKEKFEVNLAMWSLDKLMTKAISRYEMYSVQITPHTVADHSQRQSTASISLNKQVPSIPTSIMVFITMVLKHTNNIIVGYCIIYGFPSIKYYGKRVNYVIHSLAKFKNLRSSEVFSNHGRVTALSQ